MANRRFIDFPIAASVGDNDIVLIWQDGLNKQTTKATLLQGSPQSLAGLTDVDIAALTNGQILQYNSTTSKWENVDRTDINLSELGDVTIVAPANGQVLVYNSSTGKWENSSAGYVPYTGAVTTVNLGAQSILAGSFVKAGGTSAQFLKADGSVDSSTYGTGSVTSVALTMPTAFTVAGSPITTAGTLAVTGAGLVSQYIRGDGSLADFPATTGGGSSVSYYLNGSVSQGTIGGVAYKEINRTPVFGAGTDLSISADGYIASFITDALDPNKLLIPAGNWNFETYFSASSNGGSPSFYVELYKYNGTTFTLIASSSSAPELIAFGTNLNPYYSTLAVPETVLALTDRLALRYYVTHSGRTITLHTENGHLCQVITTFTTGLTALNGLTNQVQFFAVGTAGTDFAISSVTDTHTFNLPTASGTNRGALSSGDWTTFNNKENAITAGTTAQYFRGDKTFQTLNTSVVPEGTNLYYTEARVNANTNVAANTAARHNAVTLGTANGLSLSTQVLSLGLASAGVTGALSGTDWTTFNNKQNALTNPVTGTGTTNYLAKFTGSTTVGNSQIYDAGGFIGINTASTPTGLTGSTLTIRASSSNAGQSAIAIQGYDNTTRWVINGQTGTDLYNLVLFSSTTGTSYTPRYIFTPEGNLGINNQAPLAPLSFENSTGNKIDFFNNGTARYTAQINSSELRIYTTSSDDVISLYAGNVVGLVNKNGKIGIAKINPSETLDVVGTGYFTSSLTANSFVKIGGTSNQFLKADGSVDSNTYVTGGPFLPLTGGTLSGALNGTSASFSADIQSSTFFRSNTATTNSITIGVSANANYNYIGNSNYWGIRTGTAADFNIDVNNSALPINALKITQTGAATFSSSIRARNATTNASLSNPSVLGAGEFMSTGSSAGYFWEDRSLTVTSTSNWYGWYTTGATISLYNGNSNLMGINGTNGAAFFKNNVVCQFDGNNGSAGTGVYNFVATTATTSTVTQATIGSVHMADGYANLNLGSTVGGLNIFWHISKRLSADSHQLEYYYYNGSGFTSKYIFSTGGVFTATSGILVNTTTSTGDTARINGTTFTNTIMTFNPQNDNRSGVNWRLGAASIGTDTLNRRLRVNVGGVEYYIGAVEV
jgi:hypothetical protein